VIYEVRKMFNGLVELYQRMGFVGSAVTGIIILLFISGFYVNILIRRRYLSLSEELAAFCAGEIKEFQSEMLQWVTEEYKDGLKSSIDAINTNAIMDMAMEAYLKFCVTGESFLKKVNSLLITTGLFGTFLGLTSAISNVGSTLSETGAENMLLDTGASTFQILFASFQGMSVAFITSLLGTGFSILFTLAMTFFNSGQAKKLFVTQLEEYLDIKLAGESMEDKLKDSLDRKDEMNILTTFLSDSLTLFDRTVKDLRHELESLREFNQGFGQNIHQAQASVTALCQSITGQTEAFGQIQTHLSGCSEELKSLVHEIRQENRRMEGMGKLFTELNQKLDESTLDRKLFLKVVNEIPDKLLNYSEAAVARIERWREPK
jgi:methyl-accepting chemotaxis protein